MTARNNQTSATESQQIVLATPLARSRSTGPRTKQGKERSKRNSLKHGIFSKALLLEGESAAEFERLLRGLRSSLKPVGKAEEILVEKLAVLFWRYRRFLTAESAEIRKGTEFLECDTKYEGVRSTVEIMKSAQDEDTADYRYGLLQHIGQPHMLSHCIELLHELEVNLTERGFNYEEDRWILLDLYGEDPYPYQTVKYEYETWLETSESREEGRQQRGNSTPEECVSNVLDAVKIEIKRLEAHARSQKKVHALDKLRGFVPTDPQELERLLRYAASIDREIDRTLSQLERLQRMRMGHPVPPTIKLDL